MLIRSGTGTNSRLARVSRPSSPSRASSTPQYQLEVSFVNRKKLDPRTERTAPGDRQTGAVVLLALSCVSALDRIVLAEPVFDLLPLRGQHDALPFHHTSMLTVLSH
jgi:hypothetical protein